MSHRQYSSLPPQGDDDDDDFLPQPPQHTHQNYPNQYQGSADDIPLQNVAPRPLPQEPYSNPSHSNLQSHLAPLHPESLRYLDPFNNLNPFDDEMLDHALSANQNIPLLMQNTSYEYVNQQPTGAGFQQPTGGGYPQPMYPPQHTGSFLAQHTGSVPQVAIVGDSYQTNPISSQVQLYDAHMNPIRMGETATGDAPFSQGVVLDTQQGQGVGMDYQNEIQGQFEQIHHGQAGPGAFLDDPQAHYNAQTQHDQQQGESINTNALFFGNLALDCPIPSRLAAKYKIAKNPLRQMAEFLRMRYTAVTSSPERFLFDKFTLRQQLFKTPRVPCEMMVVITMYNEDDILLGRTLKGVMDNLRYLCEKKSDWGPEGWKKVVVAVVSDGRTKINPRARALMANLGVYQEGFAHLEWLKKDVTCHLYEHTTLANIKLVTDKVNFEYEDITPVQMIFALKEKNQKKINSHRWCFQALAPALKPEVIVLFDAGTEPTKRSLYKLWREFHDNPNVGGACGEIKAMLGPHGKFLYNNFFKGLLVAGQNFEYKMSNILDKPTESVFGFISVLPGAFSAYRFDALKNSPETGHGPLEAYFKGETLHNSEEKHDLFTNNMYLAEDRILCFEIVTKAQSKWVLRYINTAAAATDVPDSLAEFISQRRRWLNGSFFAAIYSVVHFGKIYRLSHSFARKLILQLEFVYNTVNIIISWFLVSLFFLVFRILTLAVSTEDGFMEFKAGKVIAIVLLWIYIACTMSVFVFSFGNKPKGAEKAYWFVAIVYALMMIYMVFCAVWLSVKLIRTVIRDVNGQPSFSDFAKNSNFRDLVILMCSTYILYIFASLLYLDPWHMLTSFIQYILLSPAYINLLNIYAFCNIHDISWGTKGDDGSAPSTAHKLKQTLDGKGLVLEFPTDPKDVDDLFIREENLINTIPGSSNDISPPKDADELAARERERKKKLADEKTEYYALVRSVVVLVWCLTNGALIAIVLNVGGAPKTKTVTDDDPTSGTNATTYLTVILWLVAVLAGFRFVGSTIYLFTRIFKSHR